MTNLRHWIYCHSFSLTMAAGTVLSSGVAAILPAGRAFDYAITFVGIFGGGFVIAIGSRHLFEKDADVTKPPKPKKKARD